MVKVQVSFLNVGVLVVGVLFKLVVEGWVSVQSVVKGGFVIWCVFYLVVIQV